MRRNYPFLLMGLAIASGVSSGCGGDEFGTVNPGSQNDRDGAADGKSPGVDGSSSGGSGGGGAGSTGGAAGSGASGGSSGAGGGGGTGGSAGKGGGSDGGGKSGASADASTDVSDGRTDDGLRADADAGRAGDVLDAQVIDGPTGSDAPGAADGARDSSVSPDASGSDVACSEPITYYKDVDGDGFGVSTESTITCTPPGNNWSVLTGDCRDDLPNVKPFSVNSPDPPRYSGTGYNDMAKPQGVSFDYDCTGTEDADPSNAYGAEPNCTLLSCTGVGYVPVNPARTGAGIDPYCGSTNVKRCTLLFANGAPQLCSASIEIAAPYQCR